MYTVSGPLKKSEPKIQGNMAVRFFYCCCLLKASVSKLQIYQMYAPPEVSLDVTCKTNVSWVSTPSCILEVFDMNVAYSTG